jgi:hypothetical protein
LNNRLIVSSSFSFSSSGLLFPEENGHRTEHEDEHEDEEPGLWHFSNTL